MSRGSDAFRIRVTTFSLRLVILKVLVLLMVTWTETLTTENKSRVHSPQQATIDEAEDFGRLPERGRVFLRCSAKQVVKAWLPEDEDEESKKCHEQKGKTELISGTSEGVCGGSYKLDVGAEIKVKFPSVSQTCDMIFTGVQQATFTFSCPKFALSPHQQEYLYVNRGASLGRVYHTSKKPVKMEGIKQLYLLYTRAEKKASKESQVECFIKEGAVKGGQGRGGKGGRGGGGRTFDAEGQQASNCSTECGLSPAFSGMTRIVGGTKTLEGEYPWVVALYGFLKTLSGATNAMLCGGTIITNRVILTAAHCIYNSFVAVVVVPGMCKVQVHFTDDFYMHPDFSPTDVENDVGLLELKQDLKWDKGVRPICLSPPKNLEGKIGIIAGFGLQKQLTPEEIKAATPQKETGPLHETAVEIWNKSHCKKAYENTTDLKIYNGNMCAASPGKDSCKGDSGGPMMVLDKGIWYQVGVTSGGGGCAILDQPGVYTKVSSFIPWILSNAKGSC